MSTKTFVSVWDALADTPAESARLKARSEMLMAVKAQVAAWGLTQSAAASRLGVTQPRLNDLLQGRVSKFSTDALFDLSTAAGLRATVTVHGVPGRKAGNVKMPADGSVKSRKTRLRTAGTRGATG
ncbi:MAG: XRE family transcriptional regulator [Nevskia sp.]|nr:XRE family transcriptional regulator [Nevskia sp.]